jgi:hypothetical protein
MDGKTARDYALEEGQFDLADLMDQPNPRPIPASAIVPALVQAAASLGAKVPAAAAAAASDMDGVVRSV